VDIKIYNDLFRKVAREKYGRIVDFDHIELKLAHLRQGGALTYSDLEIISDDRSWDFKKYWMWPSKEQIEGELKRTEEWFKFLPNNEELIIRDLSAIFKNIALVSIVLRFIWPEHYAIYSRPPLKVLKVERGFNDVEEYLNYINLLRILKDSFRVPKTADVDMIIWAVGYEKGECFKNLKKLLAKQLPENLTPEELITFLSNNPLKIAEVYFRKKDIKTAGLWAGVAFEQFTRIEYLSLFGFILEKTNGEILALVKLLCKTKKFKSECDKLHKLRKIRNKAVHKSREFTRDDARYLIETLKYFEEFS